MYSFEDFCVAREIPKKTGVHALDLAEHLSSIASDGSMTSKQNGKHKCLKGLHSLGIIFSENEKVYLSRPPYSTQNEHRHLHLTSSNLQDLLLKSNLNVQAILGDLKCAAER